MTEVPSPADLVMVPELVMLQSTSPLNPSSDWKSMVPLLTIAVPQSDTPSRSASVPRLSSRRVPANVAPGSSTFRVAPAGTSAVPGPASRPPLMRLAPEKGTVAPAAMATCPTQPPGMSTPPSMLAPEPSVNDCTCGTRLTVPPSPW